MSHFVGLTVDPAILLRARAGEPKALEILYRTFGAPVLTLAWRMLQRRDLADEVVQETFVEVIRHIRTYRGEAPLGAWIRSIAVNKCLMQMRSAWHRYGRALDDAPEPVQDCTATASLVGRDLAAALAALKPVARAVVWLHDVEGYTHDEIAALMGKTKSFSKSQLARAHERLRGLLASETVIEPCMQASKSC
jgi:RNA polymerase sigma-70 factor (ECF subfamily)